MNVAVHQGNFLLQPVVLKYHESLVGWKPCDTKQLKGSADVVIVM